MAAEVVNDNIAIEEVLVVVTVVILNSKIIVYIYIFFYLPSSIKTVLIHSFPILEDSQLQYPFFYRAMYSVLEDGWTTFLPESEFSRLVQPGDDWRISYVNKDYKVTR